LTPLLPFQVHLRDGLFYYRFIYLVEDQARAMRQIKQIHFSNVSTTKLDSGFLISLSKKTEMIKSIAISIRIIETDSNLVKPPFK
jgi:hypothetical protein